VLTKHSCRKSLSLTSGKTFYEKSGIDLFKRPRIRDVNNLSSVNKDFSYENLYGLNVRRIAPAEPLAQPRIRKNVQALRNTEEEKLLMTSLEKSIASGEYGRFVTFHSQFMFSMQSINRFNQRFLPWHRVYLVKFENIPNEVMKQETNKEYNISIPYWSWTVDRDIFGMSRCGEPDLAQYYQPKSCYILQGKHLLMLQDSRNEVNLPG
jgi:Common central domain of tyrosinase